ncbi:hypothetical protein KP509_36G064700 [Ceratopteris richardii]|uniref:SREBP regulating gene protein n=1 Tax=Ceratopteris richardii TaxID=49495 RepID=A0A8T2QD90_CERRI|nr:hypothetical protein KP509_36G064700 [Ceratopteris richardii]
MTVIILFWNDDDDGVSFAKSAFCRNTVQGRALRTDDRGYICSVLDIDYQSGCCPQAREPYPCNGCNSTTRCCDTYEYCVSCCLNPNQTSDEASSKVRIANHHSSGTYRDSFEFCMGRCRHNSKSVVHENAYATENHHCFSLPTNLSSEQPKPSIDDGLQSLAIVIGMPGQSCETACKLSKQTCQSSKLSAINKCAVLQKYFRCRGSCIASISQPAEVSPFAPSHLHPAACLFATQENVLSCEAYNEHLRRLCPCA